MGHTRGGGVADPHREEEAEEHDTEEEEVGLVPWCGWGGLSPCPLFYSSRSGVLEHSNQKKYHKIMMPWWGGGGLSICGYVDAAKPLCCVVLCSGRDLIQIEYHKILNRSKNHTRKREEGGSRCSSGEILPGLNCVGIFEPRKTVS